MFPKTLWERNQRLSQGTQWFPRPLSLKQHPPTPLALAGDQTDLYVLGWTNGIAIFFEHLWPTEVAIHTAQLTASVLLASRPGQPAGQTFSLCQSVSETFLCLCLCLSSLPPSLFLRFPSISSPSLSPLFRACTKGRGQRSGWGEQGRESAPPSPTTGCHLTLSNFLCGHCFSGCRSVISFASGVCPLVDEVVPGACAGFLLGGTDACPLCMGMVLIPLIGKAISRVCLAMQRTIYFVTTELSSMK